MSNLHFDQPKKKRSFGGKGKGFYVAMAVCLVAIGAAAWTTISSVSSLTQTEEGQTPPSSNRQIIVGVSSHQNTPSAPSVQSQTVSEQQANAKPIISSRPAASSNKPSTASQQQGTVPAVSEPVKPVVITPSTFLMPAPGRVVKAFSDDASLYSQTFGDWRIHEGIDIAMNKGSTVQAIGDGTVKDVYEDDMYGTVVVIAHEASLEARYCGLAKNTAVKKGEAVKGGQVIGSLGEIPCEIVDEAHLHFEIYKDGACVSPLVAMGKERAAEPTSSR